MRGPECPIIVWTQSYTFRNHLVTGSYWSVLVGGGRDRSAKDSRQLGVACNIWETQPIWSSRITIGALSDHIREGQDPVGTESPVSDQGRINVLCCLDDVLWIGIWSWWTGMIWRHFESWLCPDCCRFTVWSMSEFCRNTVGTMSGHILIKVLTVSCVVWTVSYGSGWFLNNSAKNWRILIRFVENLRKS